MNIVPVKIKETMDRLSRPVPCEIPKKTPKKCTLARDSKMLMHFREKICK